MTSKLKNRPGLAALCDIAVWEAGLLTPRGENPRQPGPKVGCFLEALSPLKRAAATIFVEGTDWRQLGEDIGQDGGLFTVCDLAHFADITVIPPDHRALRPHPEFGLKYAWYDFVTSLLGEHEAVIIPYGVLIHWDGGMDVETLSFRDEVLAVRVSISGWPDVYGENSPQYLGDA